MAEEARAEAEEAAFGVEEAVAEGVEVAVAAAVAVAVGEAREKIRMERAAEHEQSKVPRVRVRGEGTVNVEI